ncbi:MAG TPA: transposase [Niabella sp.]|nr:transposase [Niabella sp.]
MNNIFQHKRYSHLDIGEIYFWTATINKWQKLLLKDVYKDVIINSLLYLSNQKIIDVFAFVIMPNHIHLIWRTKALNGKESAQGSFLKYTAHIFKKMIRSEYGSRGLLPYAVNTGNKEYEFWQRDPLAIQLFRKKVAFQKLDYIHYNPLGAHWQLVKDPVEYKYSTAKFYETGSSDFSFLKDLRDEF